ncbi:hypothetical protein GCM10025875_13960 [Litorihabitans aurantiacus]|uniref:SLH domain-containing protein n=1 Tax=Litorihabitans aurantiacus TaxID=1930061 RepID=A0AA38CRZ9_9MICO|nr:hypothetical protein GCM10025875_13960 [Litorihabitans aurantiacus]
MAPAVVGALLGSVTLAAIPASMSPATAAPAPAPAPVTTTIDDRALTGTARFAYEGRWTTGSGLGDGWHAGTETYTDGTASQSVTLTFTGTRAVVLGAKHPNHGIAEITVDGEQVADFDGYATQITHGQTIVDTGDLDQGEHTVTISYPGIKNPAAGGLGGQVDRAEITGEAPVDSPWVAIPHPQELDLADAPAWSPGDLTRILIPEVGDDGLLAEAERLSSEMAQITDREAPEIVIGDEGRATPSDVVLQVGDVAVSDDPEAYTVTVGTGVRVLGESTEGVFRGTRQLVQNLTATDGVPAGVASGTPAVVERSLHLDAARKFYSKEWIIDELHDAAYVGLNTFQFHFSENEGFRIESDRYPQVVSEEHLTKEDVREILAVAKSLHIDVVPSLGMPGHLEQVLKQFPELQLRERNGDLVRGALDVTEPEAVELALDLVDEYVDLFPDAEYWNIGADEFVQFWRMQDYPILNDAAVERFGPGANGFDMLTDFANTIAGRLRQEGLVPRVWNDGMFRGSVVELDDDIQINWWTQHDGRMATLDRVLGTGATVVNFSDDFFYYVLDQAAEYKYPTAARIWNADWRPGVFPRIQRDDAKPQIMPSPYSDQLRGVSFAIWSDRPEAESEEQVSRGIREPLRAMAERSWNDGSVLTLERFAEVDRALGRAPGIDEPLGAPGTVTVLPEGEVTTPFADVAPDQQFAADIAWLAQRGITTGWDEPDGTRTFRPLTHLNRDAMAAFLHRLAGSPEVTRPATSPFADVAESDQFYDEILWLHQQGISTGWQEADGTRTFRPLEPIARDAMAAFLYRLADAEDAPVTTTPFTDVAPTDQYATEIAWAARTGITTGWTGNDGTALYRPLEPINRDAIAAFLHRFDVRAS